MKHSKYFLAAAKLIEKESNKWGGHICCCTAINKVVPNSLWFAWPNIKAEFSDLFQPAGKNGNDYWFGYPWATANGPVGIAQANARKEHRIMALLFMAEITKDSE